MAKRSPILGYNHNVQYRGVVFHVQTEDSGVVNPHIFTHLFHAGVIVNTRKLVYDPESDDGVVKSLMQSQHKAIMKELRRGLFDDKIDVYMADVPGLLPRGAGGGGDAEGAAAGGEAAPAVPALAEPALAAPEMIAEEPTQPVAVPTEIPVAPSPGSGLPKPGSGPRPLGAPPPIPASRPSAAVPIPGRSGMSSGQIKIPQIGKPAPSRATETQAVPADAPRSDLSAAFDAIAPGSGVHNLAAADAGENSDAVEVYSPPPPSAQAPPGAAPERPGSYAQHRKRDSASLPPGQPPLPPRTTGAYRAVTPPPPVPAPTPPPEAPRPATTAAAIAAAIPPGAPRPRGKTNDPISRPRTPTAPRVSAPGNVSRGGVVMSRPAVVVGTPRPGTPPPVPGGAAAAAAPKVRRAREEVGRGIFGQDLISEKSLDEVILAYLSEDGADADE